MSRTNNKAYMMLRETIEILLIEDDPGDARLIREMLLSNRDGNTYKLTICESLTEGISQIESRQFDVILLDLSLPDSTGLHTLSRLRNEVDDIAIVVLTGLSDITMVGIEAVKQGAQDYLVKDDVDSKILRRAIRYSIERKQIEIDLRRSQAEYRSLIDDVFDTSMVAVMILDETFNVVWCNEAMEIYFGFEREHVLGKDKRELIEGELKCIFADPDDYAAHLLKAYTDGIYTNRYECHVIPDETRDERWLEHWSQPIRDGMYKGGRIEQYTDITDRKILETREQDQRQFAEALTDISTVLTSSLEVNDVLRHILGNLERIVPHDSASIMILEDDHFQVAHYRANDKRDTQELVAERQLQLDHKYYINMMHETHLPVIVADLQEEAQIQNMATEANVHAYLGMPIKLHDDIIGFVNLFSESVDFFDDTHATRLFAFAELAAIAIQNARLFGQSHTLAALQERQRLARELHDSVSQTVFTCRTMAETALRRWDKDPSRAKELVEDVYQLSMTALGEMRILLLELRPASLTQVGLKQLFEQYLQPIQDRRQFDLEMDIDDFKPLPPDVQIGLYRITQEALNNIDKHAQATRVNIQAKDDESHITLEIQDNGGGFDLATVRATSLGINIMKERAEEIGASIQIESKLDEGTRIIVHWTKQDKGE